MVVYCQFSRANDVKKSSISDHKIITQTNKQTKHSDKQLSITYFWSYSDTEAFMMAYTMVDIQGPPFFEKKLIILDKIFINLQTDWKTENPILHLSTYSNRNFSDLFDKRKNSYVECSRESWNCLNGQIMKDQMMRSSRY